MDIFVRYPFLAFGIALVFGGSFLRYRKVLGRERGALVFTALCWLLYGAWEYYLKMYEPHANIRLDLFFIYPILFIASISAVYSVMKARSRK